MLVCLVSRELVAAARMVIGQTAPTGPIQRGGVHHR